MCNAHILIYLKKSYRHDKSELLPPKDKNRYIALLVLLVVTWKESIEAFPSLLAHRYWNCKKLPGGPSLNIISTPTRKSSSWT